MNRAWIRLLACGLLCVLLLSGCAGEPVGDDYALYFRARDLRSAAGEGALQTERWTPPEQDLDTAALAEAMMEALLAGPAEETLQNTIPAGTALLSLTLNGSQAVVDLSPAYSSLSGVELTLADQAVALTLTQLPEILSVRITVRGQELAYRDKQVFTGQDVLLAPEGDVVDTVTAALYFPNADGVLTEETRTLNLYEGTGRRPGDGGTDRRYARGFPPPGSLAGGERLLCEPLFPVAGAPAGGCQAGYDPGGTGPLPVLA